MAIAKTGAGIIEIRGKSGGTIFRRDQSGQHLQTNPRLVKKNSLAQNEQRKRFTQACQFCMEHLGL